MTHIISWLLIKYNLGVKSLFHHMRLLEFFIKIQNIFYNITMNKQRNCSFVNYKEQFLCYKNQIIRFSDYISYMPCSISSSSFFFGQTIIIIINDIIHNSAQCPIFVLSPVDNC